MSSNSSLLSHPGWTQAVNMHRPASALPEARSPWPHSAAGRRGRRSNFDPIYFAWFKYRPFPLWSFFEYKIHKTGIYLWEIFFGGYGRIFPRIHAPTFQQKPSFFTKRNFRRFRVADFYMSIFISRGSNVSIRSE